MKLKLSVVMPDAKKYAVQTRRVVYEAMAKGFEAAEPKARMAAGQYLATRLRIRGQKWGAVATSFGAKTHYRKLDEPPVIGVYCNIPWMRIHETGGTVTGFGRGLLIPITNGGPRMGPKEFARNISNVLRDKKAHFIPTPTGVVIAIEDDGYGHDRHLRHLAIFIREAHLRKRTDFTGGAGWSRVKSVVVSVVQRKIRALGLE